MEAKSAAKVGLVSLCGIALFLAFWAFLTHLRINRYQVTAVFDDARGLAAQTAVQMNGKIVGEVASVDLRPDDLKPVVTLAIDGKYRIPANARIRIASGILITAPQVQIYWSGSPAPAAIARQWPEDQVDKPQSLLATVSPEAQQAVKSLTASLQDLSPLLKQSLHQLQGILASTGGTMQNLKAATGSARDLLADPALRRSVRETLANLQLASANARDLSKSLNTEMTAMIKRNGGKVDEFANNALDLLVDLKETMGAARAMVAKLSDQIGDPRLQQSLQETLDLAKSTLARFNQIASDIHQLTGDPDVQTNLKVTTEKLRDASEKGDEIAKRVGKIVDRIGIPSVKRPFGIGEPQFLVDLRLGDRTPQFRSDVLLRLPIGNKGAARLGLWDFADRNRLIAQYETRIGDGSARYGIYASKLGIGWEQAVGKRSRLMLDLHDPNHLQVDARALVDINKDFGLWFGADSLFRETIPVIGARLTR
jgi:phospholipid/cholesterol/gamma-HCH transport system substrate-binding protein